MEITVLDLIELTKNGKKIALLNINRATRRKSINKLKKAIERSKTVYSPLQIIDGEDVVKENWKIIDWETKKEVSKEEAKNYIVILDGQHRWAALKELQQEAKKTITYQCWAYYPIIEKEKIADFLKDLNTTSTSWDTSAYITWQLGQEEDILLKEVQDLVKGGYKYTSACEWVRLKEGEIKRNEITEGKTKRKEEKETIKENINLGKQLLQTAKESLTEDFCKTKTLPSWLIKRMNILIESGESKEDSVTYLTKFLEKIKENKEEITKLKGKKGEYTKDQCISRELDKLYKEKISQIKKNK